MILIFLKNNRIDKIKINDVEWLDSREDIGEAFCEFFLKKSCPL